MSSSDIASAYLPAPSNATPSDVTPPTTPHSGCVDGAVSRTSAVAEAIDESLAAFDRTTDALHSAAPAQRTSAIRVTNLTKRFRVYDRPQDRLWQSLRPRSRALFGVHWPPLAREHVAIDNISFEIAAGQAVGLVGRNGSGKSTLLQILCGTLPQTSGHVTVDGRVSALLELGAGFNPEFTGRENVILNATILGISRAVLAERFSEIVAFSGIGAAIEQPVKTYSSGMFLRLAFAVAIAIEPDILIVDEALAVGDEGFQRKCFASFEAFRARGGTLVLVTHAAQLVVQLCDRAMLIDRGELLLDGDPRSVVAQYQRLVNISDIEADAVRDEIRSMTVVSGANLALHNESQPRPPMATPGPISVTLFDPASDAHSHSATAAQVKRIADQGGPALDGFDPLLVSTPVAYEPQGAVIRDLHVLTLDGRSVNILEQGRRYAYHYTVDFLAEATEVGFGMLINTPSGLGIAGATTAYHRTLKTRHVARGATASVCFEFDCRLTPGTYFLNAGVLGAADGRDCYLHRLLDGLAFRVCTAQTAIATGLVDLGITPQIAIVGSDLSCTSFEI